MKVASYFLYQDQLCQMVEYFLCYYFFSFPPPPRNKEWITFESKALNSIWCSRALLQWPPAWEAASRVTLAAQEPCAAMRNPIPSCFRIFSARKINSVVFWALKGCSLLWGLRVLAYVSLVSNVPDTRLSSFSAWLRVAGALAVVGGHTTPPNVPNTTGSSIFSCWNQQEWREKFWGRRRKRNKGNEEFCPNFLSWVDFISCIQGSGSGDAWKSFWLFQERSA